jgi:hypothetical protein
MHASVAVDQQRQDRVRLMRLDLIHPSPRHAEHHRVDGLEV